MKTNLFKLLICFCVGILFFSSCNKEGKNSIIGKWKVEYNKTYSDGKLVNTDYDNRGLIIEFTENTVIALWVSAAYIFKDNVLTIDTGYEIASGNVVFSGNSMTWFDEYPTDEYYVDGTWKREPDGKKTHVRRGEQVLTRIN